MSNLRLLYHRMLPSPRPVSHRGDRV